MKLKEAKEQQNLTQSELAKLLNIDTQRYQNYELGKRKPTPEMLKTIANCLRVSVDYLLDNEKNFANSFGFLSDKQKAIVEKIKQLAPDELQRVEDFIAGITGEPFKLKKEI